ncbi:hypothetical protein BaRGS_00038544 [Batillaria attramentaria]|uniref:Uncharacterized protein n=1 Tax=Batillaria attramentaria TaxID=370345 RepID=A0ABD0J176_9CAEN
MFKMPPTPLIIAAVCCAVALVLQSIALAERAWAINKFGLGVGLYKTCIENPLPFGDKYICKDLYDADETPGWLSAVRWCGYFATLGMTAGFGCIGASFFFQFEIFDTVALSGSGVATLCTLLEVVLWKNYSGYETMGSSYNMTWAAFGLCLVADALIGGGRKKE